MSPIVLIALVLFVPENLFVPVIVTEYDNEPSLTAPMVIPWNNTSFFAVTVKLLTVQFSILTDNNPAAKQSSDPTVKLETSQLLIVSPPYASTIPSKYIYFFSCISY